MDKKMKLAMTSERREYFEPGLPAEVGVEASIFCGRAPCTTFDVYGSNIPLRNEF